MSQAPDHVGPAPEESTCTLTVPEKIHLKDIVICTNISLRCDENDLKMSLNNNNKILQVLTL